MLSDVKARKAQPGERDYKLSDEKGLYLLIRPSGSKLWRMNFRHAGKSKTLSFGAYPEVSLAEARDRRDEARRLLRDGTDPAIDRKRKALAARVQAVNSFEAVAGEWLALQRPSMAPTYADEIERCFKKDVFGPIGKLPLSAIDAPLVLDVLRKVERRGSAVVAKRMRQWISSVFTYAISTGIARDDPAALISKALKPPASRSRQAALTKVEDLRALLADVESETCSPIVILASRLLALTAVRPAIVHGARWSEFHGINLNRDGDTGSPYWHIPAARMKLTVGRKGDARFDHIVPLAPAAVEVLRAIHRLTGRGEMVFPNKTKSGSGLSENAIAKLYKRAGKGRWKGRHVPHGWRAAFSTIMNERAIAADNPGDRQVIDLMLGHVPPNTVESAYNRAQFMPRRREIAEEWAALIMAGGRSAESLLELDHRAQ